MSAARRATHVIGEAAGRLVALELARVSEVVPMLAIEPVPGGPVGLVGFANLGGEPVPVLSLRVLFAATAAAPAPSQRIVVCRDDARTFGLVLDAAHGLDTVGALRSPTADDRLVASEVVKAVGVVGDRLCFVLEPEVVVEWLARVLAPTPLVAVPAEGAA